MSTDYRNRPLFDVASYGRGGPRHRDRLSGPEIDQVRRTVHRTPEVMVKVLTGGQPTVRGARMHLAYVGRDGEVPLETDAGERLTGEGAAAYLVDDWDLDLEQARPGSALRTSTPTRTPKLVHKLVFSMPPGTPPDKVLGAVRDFAREEFGAKHRYAFVLHTDDDHPHVHLVVKAMSEEGDRLNIRKDTLRAWRARFAEQLRARGLAANATERAVRGKSTKALKDGIYRAAERRSSTHLRERARAAAKQIGAGTRQLVDPGERTLLLTSETVQEGYRAIATLLDAQGERDLGAFVRRFAGRIAYPPTEQQIIRDRVRGALEQQRVRSRDDDLTMLR